MPPPGAPRPDKATYDAVTAHLERALDAAIAAKPNPGHVPVHRLNRTEYTNAIRDLLGLKIDGESLLIADEPDKHGFENIAGLLSVSPSRLERYLAAARKVSRLAVGDPTINPTVETYTIPAGLVQDDRVSEDLPFGTQGGISIDHSFPIDAEYSIKILLQRQVYLYILGMGEAHELDVRIDGVRVKRFSVGGEGKGMTAPESYAGNTQGDPAWEEYMHTADAHLEVRVPVKAGVRKVGVAFVRQYWEREGINSPRQTGYAVVTNENYFESPSVESVLIGGPYNLPGQRQYGRHSQSPQDIFVPPERSRERGALRHADSVRVGVPGVSASRDKRGCPDVAAAFTGAAMRPAGSRWAFSEGWSAFWRRRVFCSESNGSQPAFREHRIASPIWSSRRVYRFSCGAASLTPS